MKKRRLKTKASIFAFATFLVAFTYASSAPSGFPSGITLEIEPGSGLSEIADKLEEEGLIRSAFLFKSYVVAQGGSTSIRSGEYLFAEPKSSLNLAGRLVRGEEGIPRVKITVPEGLASYDIARLLKKNLPLFDSVRFLELAKPEEGYLFPDTYFFTENVTPERVVAEMKANFETQVGKLAIPLSFMNMSLHEILTMASIVEKEARDTEDRRRIAGVLWKRIEIDMPLQVDPPFFYLLGKTSAQLTTADLAMDSPYNTYRYKGLPPAPIANPSLDAISATVRPIKSDYLFFLAGTDGKIYYAEDHDGHLANKRKYMN